MVNSKIPLDYQVLTPKTQSDGPSPAAFFLHGYGANELDLLSLSNYFPSDIFIISLRAPFPISGGYCWYPIHLSSTGTVPDQPDLDSLTQSMDLLSQSRDALIDLCDLSPKKIGLLGFSQGTILSLSALCTNPSNYSWCVGLNGYLPRSFSNSSTLEFLNKSVFLSAGINDELIPLSKVETTRNKLVELGCDVTFSSHSGGHYIGENVFTELQQWLPKHIY